MHCYRPLYPRAKTRNARTQAFVCTHTHTDTQGPSADTGSFNPVVGGRSWQAHTIPLASRLTIHSLVIGGNLIPIPPSQSQALQNRQPSKSPHQEGSEAGSPLPTLVSLSTLTLEMGFTNLATCTHTHTHDVILRLHTHIQPHIHRNLLSRTHNYTEGQENSVHEKYKRP